MVALILFYGVWGNSFCGTGPRKCAEYRKGRLVLSVQRPLEILRLEHCHVPLILNTTSRNAAPTCTPRSENVYDNQGQVSFRPNCNGTSEHKLPHSGSW